MSFDEPERIGDLERVADILRDYGMLVGAVEVERPPRRDRERNSYGLRLALDVVPSTGSESQVLVTHIFIALHRGQVDHTDITMQGAGIGGAIEELELVVRKAGALRSWTTEYDVTSFSLAVDPPTIDPSRLARLIRDMAACCHARFERRSSGDGEPREERAFRRPRPDDLDGFADPESGRQADREATVPPRQKPKPRFVVHSVNEPTIRACVRPDGASRAGRSEPPPLYLFDSAWNDIERHIDWGAHTARNFCEQGGLLVGMAHRDPADDSIYCIADRAVPADNAAGNPVFLNISHRDWGEMLSRIDEMKVNGDLSEEHRIVGWYHTHPNTLDVFMSGTDLTTQRQAFPEPWHIALVINPHRQLVAAFRGARAEAVRVDLPAWLGSQDDLRSRHGTPPGRY